MGPPGHPCCRCEVGSRLTCLLASSLETPGGDLAAAASLCRGQQQADLGVMCQENHRLFSIRTGPGVVPHADSPHRGGLSRLSE